MGKTSNELDFFPANCGNKHNDTQQTKLISQPKKETTNRVPIQSMFMGQKETFLNYVSGTKMRAQKAMFLI